VAKEQGYRSRAAFKLIQINRQFNLFASSSNDRNNGCNIVLDLCAAPGGWSQVVAKTCPAATTKVIAVDILPIRSFSSATTKNMISTIVGDITTPKCQAEIARTVQQLSSGNNEAKKKARFVSLVLHDGAPNIGADYNRDAYVQNELALCALQCATQHLRPGGTFCTKLYRSRDYLAFTYILQQLFDSVQTYKPVASRNTSSEMFVICSQYKAPLKLDPRLLSPAHVFAPVEDQDSKGPGPVATTVFHKNWEKLQSSRHRTGYDGDATDTTVARVVPVTKFLDAATSTKEAIQILSTATQLSFRRPEESRDDGMDSSKLSFYENHPLTTREIKECIADLKVLNKADFKALLTWRNHMVEASAESNKGAHDSNDDDASKSGSESDANDSVEQEEDEDQIQGEIEEMRQRRLREMKRQKKRTREMQAKRRRIAALSGDVAGINTEHDNDPLSAAASGSARRTFTLATLTNAADLAAAAEVNLDHVTDEQILVEPDEDIVVIEGEGSGNDSDDADDDDDKNRLKRRLRREKELDDAYMLYLQNTKNQSKRADTRLAKRSKRLQSQLAAQETAQDIEMARSGDGEMKSMLFDYDAKTYAKLLSQGTAAAGSDDSDDSSASSDDDDGFHDVPTTPEEHAASSSVRLTGDKESGQKRQKTSADSVNPLLHQFPTTEDTPSARTARWFSNPLFASIGQTVDAVVEAAAAARVETSSDSPNRKKNSSTRDEKEKEAPKLASKERRSKPKVGLDAEEVMAMMPKTDKEVRHERRLKAMARDERRKARRAKQNGMEEESGHNSEFEVVTPSSGRLNPRTGAGDSDDSDDDDGTQKQGDNFAHLSDAQRQKLLDARALIKAGIGTTAGAEAIDENFEVVPASEGPLPIMDTRKYDSDHEDYDSDDYARTLALGTMMLRRSKEKALVDASYNRYAWNDPAGLPDWFVDDETKHYRPQLPIPPALIEKMKQKQLALASKPIKKVAEARARKSKRARAKLTAAKKQAQTLANSSEMSEAMKLKAISKALRGQETRRPSKTYVVAKKGRSNSAGKGTKLVDKRLKSDKRGMDRAAKSRGTKRKR
jgi:23S rRNA U2552 (ribose-2'-O)-methylase RlmE/FtsJ